MTLRKFDDDTPDRIRQIFETMPPKRGGVGVGTIDHAQREAGGRVNIMQAPAQVTYGDYAASQPDAGADTTRDRFSSWGLRDPVSDSTLESIDYYDDNKLWVRSPMGAVTQLVSKPKSGKTGFILREHMDLARRGVARILYVPLEGLYGVVRHRIPAIAEHLGIDLADLRGRFQVAEWPGFAFGDAESVEASIRFLNKTGVEAAQGGWTHVIYDTQHRADGGLDENSANDSRRRWDAVDHIRRQVRHDGDRWLNVTLLHHIAKSANESEIEDGRGSGGDAGALDQFMVLQADKDARVGAVSVPRRKDGPDNFTVFYRVSLGAEGVPLWEPTSPAEYRRLKAESAQGGLYAPSTIGRALARMKATDARPVTTSVLAAELLQRTWLEIGVDPKRLTITSRTVENNVTKGARGGPLRAYVVDGPRGELPDRNWLWRLPADEQVVTEAFEL